MNYLTVKKEKNEDKCTGIIWDIITAVLCILISVNESTALVGLGLVYLGLLSLKRSPLYNVYTLLIIFPFENIFRLGGNNFIFLILLCMIYKTIRTGIDFSKWFLPSIIIIGIELFNCYMKIGIGNLVLTSVYLLVFVSIFLSEDLRNWNQVEATKRLFISYLSTLISMIYICDFSGFNDFITEFSGQVTDSERFGMEATNLGGTMGVPIYSALVLAASVLIINKKTNPLFKVVSVIFILISLVFGIMTVAKFFLLAVVLVGCMILFFAFVKLNRRYFVILIVLTVLISLFAVIFRDYAVDSINKILYRTDSIAQDYRAKIWKSSIRFLFSDLRAFFIGYGANYYHIVGYIKREYFSAHTHNFFLDIFMSWGAVGFTMFLSVIGAIVSQFRRYVSENKKLIFNVIPLLVLILWFHTAGTVSTLKSYIMLGFSICSLFFGDEVSA